MESLKLSRNSTEVARVSS